jgi:hypothetical protein
MPPDDGGIGEGGGGGVPQVVVIDLTLPDLTTANNQFSSFGKPMLLSSRQDALGTISTNFLVDKSGYVGVNVERPRASSDIRSTSAQNFPAMIVGRKAIGNPDRTRHVHFVPWLRNNGWNGISQAGDHGMFFTDGNGADGSNSSAGLVIAPWADNLFTGGLRMDNMGNVELRGDLRATKVTVDAVWWPDFVFAKDYSLMPLQQVKAYIQTHKHLPDMPSEDEIKENGQNMGELQKLQQQKIEELTLYTIDQDEKIRLLEEKLIKLQQLVETLLD